MLREVRERGGIAPKCRARTQEAKNQPTKNSAPRNPGAIQSRSGPVQARSRAQSSCKSDPRGARQWRPGSRGARARVVEGRVAECILSDAQGRRLRERLTKPVPLHCVPAPVAWHPEKSGPRKSRQTTKTARYGGAGAAATARPAKQKRAPKLHRTRLPPNDEACFGRRASAGG